MKKLISIFIVTAILFVVTSFLMSYTAGITGRTTTGCTCHGTPSAGNSVSAINANPDMFSEGFSQGNTYTLTVSVTGPGGTTGGFNLKASMGQLTNPGSNAKINAAEGTHSNSNSRTWTIDWVAPSTATDSVVFNFTGNAVNGDGTSSGDDPTVPVRRAAYKKSTSIAEKNNLVITSFKLFQNYPNPFNSETKIGYQINTAGNVELRIFDLRGRKIYHSSQAHLSGGNYVFTWQGVTLEGRPVASGVYTYQVIFNDITQNRKLILLK